MEALAGRFHFGPYEADARARELRNRGLRIRLRHQSFEVLIALLERSGEVVTREELQRRLWPEGTFVEFESSLNSAMNRLRSALHDKTDSPKYVETLPRVGYRFIAPVEQIAVARPRLAVLPFDNIGRDAGSDFFADAVTDALITELGNVNGLRVISRQSVLHLKGTRKTAPEIADELKVDLIVEGSVFHAAGRVRTTAQLIQIEPEQHLWAKAYEYHAADLLTQQGQIARAIAEAIQVALSSGEVARLERPRPRNLEAHAAYLKGRGHIGRWSPADLTKALAYLASAVEKDPRHALAYAHMADCYAGLGFWGVMPARKAFPKAKKAARKALALDPAQSAAHWAFAWSVWFQDRDLATCEEELLRAIALNPSDERAHEAYSFFLVTTGADPARALSEMNQALNLDPLSQRVNSMAAWLYLFVRDYERAIEQAHRNMQMFVESLQAFYVLGIAESCCGRHEDAIATLEKAAAICQDGFSTAFLGSALARAGRPDRARDLLDDLLSRRRRENVAPRCCALLCTSLGERDLALDWLERAFEARDAGLFTVGVMPLYDPLHSDPRFESMLQRLRSPHRVKPPLGRNESS